MREPCWGSQVDFFLFLLSSVMPRRFYGPCRCRCGITPTYTTVTIRTELSSRRPCPRMPSCRNRPSHCLLEVLHSKSGSIQSPRWKTGSRRRNVGYRPSYCLYSRRKDVPNSLRLRYGRMGSSALYFAPGSRGCCEYRYQRRPSSPSVMVPVLVDTKVIHLP
jgi:hypothetical protein